MVRKTYTAEQIINELRGVEIHINQGFPNLFKFNPHYSLKTSINNI